MDSTAQVPQAQIRNQNNHYIHMHSQRLCLDSGQKRHAPNVVHTFLFFILKIYSPAGYSD